MLQTDIEDEDIPSSDSNEMEQSKEKNIPLTLELSDIIQIRSATNDELDEQKFIIDYIDDKLIRLIDITTFNEKELHLSDEGFLTDESITEILLLNRSKEKGYARQNGLLVNVWIDIHIGGQIPQIITGKITNLENDMIEVTTVPDNDVIYIDFEYKGIPLNIPFTKFVIREQPDLREMGLEDSSLLEEGEIEEDDSRLEFTNEGEYVVHIPENAQPEENIHKKMERLFARSDDVIFGENLDAITQIVEVPESQRRYGIQVQTNDMLDTMLSTIPNNQRTKDVMNNIHNLIERYKELREQYSKFDDSGTIYGTVQRGYMYKPLTEHCENFDRKIRWLIPVVSQKKKLYDISDETKEEEGQDVIYEKSETVLLADELAFENYKNNVVEGDDNKYDQLYNKLNRSMTPFIYDASHKRDHLVYRKEVLTDFETIVGTMDNFNSSVYKEEFQRAQRKYVIQKYNLGITKLSVNYDEAGKKVFIRSKMTPNDEISVKSLLMLPEPVVKYSQIDLPGTNIMIKTHLSQMHLDMSRVLNSKTNINETVVSDLTKEINYESFEKDTNVAFLSEVKDFSLDVTLNSETNKFHKFLNAIIPQSRTIIHLFKKYINDKLSLVDICRELEPFMIYTNNLVYGQYNEIRFFIKERINEYYTKLAEREKYFSQWRTTDYHVSLKANNIYKLVNEKAEIFNRILDAYKFQNKDSTNYLSSSEILFNSITQDESKYLYTLITIIMHTLITPKNIMDAITKIHIDDMSDVEKVTATDCNRRVLAKKYLSMQELQKDNNTEDVYFDKDFDETPYSILKKYDKEQKSMPPELFAEFLTETLVQVHDAPLDVAKELAQTFLLGKKPVREGEYAILEMHPHVDPGVDITKLSESELQTLQSEADRRKRVQYYKRKHNVWILDKDVTEEYTQNGGNNPYMLFVDTNTLFCNMSKKCKKEEDLQICTSIEQSAKRGVRSDLKSMENEFEKRYTVSSEKMLDDLRERLNYYLYIIQRKRIIEYTKITKYNNIQYYIGKGKSKDEVIQSPYADGFDLILSQADFAKKQLDIAKFVETFCRTPMLDLKEDPHWHYCLESNVKLVPSFLYELAVEFITGGDYVNKMNEICNIQGAISDDQDAFVDKYSGYVIRKIDFATEEQYSAEGFKVTSHTLMQKDLQTSIGEILSKNVNQRVFENALAEMMFNVLKTLCSNIDIPLDGVEEMSLRTAIDLFEQNIWSREKYDEESKKKLEKKGKSSPPYEKYKNRNILLYTTVSLLITIQTAIPSFKPKKSFPNCVRSFTGYPLAGVEDLSTIKYIACVLQRSKSDIAPWNALVGIKEDVTQTLLKEIIDTKIINKRPDLMNLYARKREYISLEPEDIPLADQLSYKWRLFMPPIVEYSIINSLHPLGSDFKNELLESIRTGNRKQREHITMMQSKITYYTFGLMELIQKIVKQKNLLLKTSSHVPFVENACCNDKYHNPLKYFISEDDNVLVYIKHAIDIEKWLNEHIYPISKGHLLFHNKATGIKYANNLSNNFENEQIIYSAFLFYLNFDNDLPIPIDMIPLWGSGDKMGNYSSNWSLEKKIEFMKENGKQYTIQNLHQLMNIVYKRNMDNLPVFKNISQMNAIVDLFNSIYDNDYVIIEEPLRRHITNVFSTHKPNVAHHIGEDRKEIKTLKDYLQLSNEKMMRVIQDFIIKYGNNKYYKLEPFIKGIADWNDNDIHKTTLFIETMIYNMTKVYPSMIINNSDHNYVPKHWNLSAFHNSNIQDFVKNYWKHLNKFKDSDSTSVLQRLLMEAERRFTDINLFIKNLPIESHIQKGENEFYSIFDKKTTHYLYLYCWLSILHEYIMMSQDSDLLQSSETQKKKYMRSVIAKNRDESEILEDDTEYLNDQEAVMTISDQMSLQKKVCELIITFIEMGQMDKKALDLPYEEISRKMRMVKIKEKNKITEFFADKDKDNRNIEVMLKQLKMGRWDVEVVKYNKSVYDSEVMEMDEDLFAEEDDDDEFAQAIANDPDVPDRNQQNIGSSNAGLSRELIDDIFGDDEDDADEGNDFGNLGEDYLDGVYYDEDREKDDFGDES